MIASGVAHMRLYCLFGERSILSLLLLVPLDAIVVIEVYDVRLGNVRLRRTSEILGRGVHVFVDVASAACGAMNRMGVYCSQNLLV